MLTGDNVFKLTKYVCYTAKWSAYPGVAAVPQFTLCISSGKEMKIVTICRVNRSYYKQIVVCAETDPLLLISERLPLLYLVSLKHLL